MMGAVYVILDPAAPLPLLEQARAAARGGAWAVQLRDKHATDAVLIRIARALINELRPIGAKVIVNDRLNVAIEADADGLHIGQSDGDPTIARTRLGRGKLLGLSVGHPELCPAIPAGIDYIGVGPIRATTTKSDHAPPIGIAGLADIVARSPVPAFAIGGIASGDAAGIKHSGAAGMAIASAILRAADAEVATRAFLAEWTAA
jgi:thiamine-phosphate pyrophosphorylase